MLAVQEYLKTKTFEDLNAELGIVVRKHDTLPLAIINYDQIDSPKTNPIVRECRALVLHTETKEIVAKSFNRFFNWGEVQEEMGNFDFSDFIVQSKEDGSLCVLFTYDGTVFGNTRGSFAVDKMEFQNFTWQEAFCRALQIQELADLKDVLNPSITYVCEFCSPWNKIVRRYDEPAMYLLTAFQGEEELSNELVDKIARTALFKRPTRYEFHSIEEIQAFLDEQAKNDATFEGVVIKDKHGHRWKIKSATYLGLHKLRGEGDNVWNPKHLLPFIMGGEDAELLTYFPEVSETYYKLKADLQGDYIKVLETWIDNKDIKEQKDFALAIQGKTPYTSILFTARKKHGPQAPSASLKAEWKDADTQILRRLK